MVRLAAIAMLVGMVVCLPSQAAVAGNTDVPASVVSKDVVAVVEPFPNYVFHLLAVARVGFDSDYATRYRDTVPSDDLAVLDRHRDLLAWGDGRMGALTSIFVFFPVYLNLAKPDDCVEYYDMVAAGAKSGSSASLLSRYGEAMERQRFWVAPGDFLSEPLGPAANHKDAVAELSRVFGRSYSTYLEKVWPREKTELDARATVLNRRLREENIIGRWEALVGETFRFPREPSPLHQLVHVGERALGGAFEVVAALEDRDETTVAGNVRDLQHDARQLAETIIVY
jgi:hypothetical protein